PEAGSGDVTGKRSRLLRRFQLKSSLPDLLTCGILNFSMHTDRTTPGRAAAAEINHWRLDREVAVRASLDVHCPEMRTRLDLQVDFLPGSAGLNVPILLAVRNFRIPDPFNLAGIRPGIHHAQDHLVFPG